MHRLLLCLILPLLLAACAEPVWAPDEAVAKARYVSTDAPSITLFTVVRKTGEEGAHSGLLINASQRVMFDPAGTWYNPASPERNDLHFGITPRVEQLYINYHSRETYDVYRQTVLVSPEVAEMALQRASSNGAVGKAMCGKSVSKILKGLPGFESIGGTMFPGTLMREFGELPGVTTDVFHENDADNNKAVLAEQLSAVEQ